MRIGIQIPDEWSAAIDAAAKKDGHKCRSAIIRKAVQIFLFADNEKQDPRTGRKPAAAKESREHDAQE